MLKKIWVFIACLLFKLSASADCRSNGIWLLTSESTLNQNSLIIIEGYANSQKIILGLNKKYPTYLLNGLKKVKLNVREILVGQFELTQAVLIPEEKLIIGRIYTMYIDNLPEGEIFQRFNKITQESEIINFKVVAKTDTTRPILKSRPKVIKKTLHQYGCGPAAYVVFDFPIKDSSDVYVKATVKNMKLGIEIVYYIKPKDNKLEIGHSMCSGAFKFDDGKYFEIEFSIIDTSGNITQWTGKRIEFTKPI